MNLRHRWWVAAMLLCVGAAWAHRARADGASPRPAPAGAPSVASVTGQAPLALLRPVAVETIERALREADALYRSRQSAQALHAYATLVEIDVANPQAWLRLGNLHQQAGRDEEAIDAYRRAARVRAATPPEAEARGKALLNIALLGIAEATRAIDEVEAMKLSALDDTRENVAEQLGMQQRRADRSAGQWLPPQPPLATPPAPAAPAAQATPPVQPAARSVHAPPASTVPTTAAAVPIPRSASTAAVRVAPAPAPTPAAAEAFEPFTVDRWIAKARRAVGARTTGRAAVSEPVTETPLPPLPVIETYRGGSGGRRP
jgi:tetratricopeptide (TPR) repeat protein